jgi:hypothetical protein
MMECGRMPQRTIQLIPVLRRELPWFALMTAALLAAFVLGNLVIRRGILLPSLASSGGAPPWVWAALYAPELVAVLMIGWRLRSWALIALYAGGAAALREGFHLALRLLGDGSEHARFASPAMELAVAIPVTIAAYAVVFAASASTGRDESASAAGREGSAAKGA